MSTKILVTLLCALSILFASAQEEFVTGELYDRKTNEPIPFATIRMKGYAIGVISNLDGGFRIPLKFKEYGEVLEISSMGYRTKEISLSSLSGERINVVRLAPGILTLNEVVVKGKMKRKKIFSARQVVEKAIGNITGNYPMEPFSTVGYYRDYQYENEQYLNLNEAILEVFDKGYGSIDTTSTEVLIYDLMQNKNFYRDTMALDAYDYKDGKKVVEKAFLPAYGGNEFAILRIHDAIRNYKIDTYSFIYQFEDDLLRNHRFSFEPDTYIDGENLYTVRFKKDLGDSEIYPDHSAYGLMYVSKKDFAIHGMEYSVYNKKRRLPKGELNKHGENSELVFEVKSEYRRVEDKMFLNYISFYNMFQIRQPPKLQTESIIVDVGRECFRITFNKEVDGKEAIKKRNYKVMFKNNRVKFDKIVHFENQVFLYPKPQFKKSMFETINEVSGRSVSVLLDPDSKAETKIDKSLLYFTVENIQDNEGNRLNEWSYKDYNQFREFFVQKVEANVKAPINPSFMDKRRPIFKDQPSVRPENFDQYWMNTPLQKSEQQKNQEQKSP